MRPVIGAQECVIARQHGAGVAAGELVRPAVGVVDVAERVGRGDEEILRASPAQTRVGNFETVSWFTAAGTTKSVATPEIGGALPDSSPSVGCPPCPLSTTLR